MKKFILSEFDAHVFAGMLLAELGHPVFEREWERNKGAYPKENAKMLLNLLKQHKMQFNKEEVDFIKSKLNDTV